MSDRSFDSLGLSPGSLKAVAALGFEEASPIQAAAIPVLLTGRDLVGQSQTGSGKTAAFALPAIEKVDVSDRRVQVLILCPTRELATQVADEVHKLAAFKPGLHAVPIYGGAAYGRQFFELNKGAHIVIGTPGRVMDHMERGSLKFDGLKVAVLDEADRMLDMGFRDDIQHILEATPDSRQTVFFSATVSPPIRQLIQRFARDPETVKIEQKQVTSPTVEQVYYEVQRHAKFEALIRLIDFHHFRYGIIFCNTQRQVDELADALDAQGFSSDRLHGGIAQQQRTRVMDKFKNSEFEFLVATDVAGRGIDVESLELVVNFDLPYDAEDYVHRIGRTGRAGRRGMAVTFVSGRDVYKVQQIERFTRTRMQRGRIPSMDEIEARRSDKLADELGTILAGEAYREQLPLVERLLDQDHNPADIAAAVLHRLLVGAPAGAAPVAANMSADAPAPAPAPTPAPAPSAPRPARPAKAAKPAESPAAEPPALPPETPAAEEEAPADPVPPRPKPSAKASAPARGVAGWIILNLKRTDGVPPRDIVTLVAEGSGIAPRDVGEIVFSDHETFVQVPAQEAERIVAALAEFDLGGQPVKARVADTEPPARRGRPPGPTRPGKPGGKFAGPRYDRRDERGGGRPPGRAAGYGSAESGERPAHRKGGPGYGGGYQGGGRPGGYQGGHGGGYKGGYGGGYKGGGPKGRPPRGPR